MWVVQLCHVAELLAQPGCPQRLSALLSDGFVLHVYKDRTACAHELAAQHMLPAGEAAQQQHQGSGSGPAASGGSSSSGGGGGGLGGLLGKGMMAMMGGRCVTCWGRPYRFKRVRLSGCSTIR